MLLSKVVSSETVALFPEPEVITLLMASDLVISKSLLLSPLLVILLSFSVLSVAPVSHRLTVIRSLHRIGSIVSCCVAANKKVQL